MAELFKSLKGKPQLKALVTYTDQAHEQSTKKHQLAEAYGRAGSDIEKTRILKDIEAVNEKQHQAVDNFKKELDGLAVYLKGVVVKIFIAIAATIMTLLAAMTL